MSAQRIEQLADGVTLYLGDCRDVLPTLGLFDAVVTDPPYGIGFAADPTKWQERAGHLPDTWDDKTFSGLDDIIACGRAKIVWGGNYYELPRSRGWLAWFKPDSPPSMADFELAWTNLDKNARKITHSISATNPERVGHPTQKPVAVMLFCLDQLPPNTQSIIDPFMGSGTTGVAAVRRGKAFCGIEREPKYFEMAIRRISDALSRPQLFPPAPAPLAKQGTFL
jgi:site-specific DNA-methyltransferase (adenine-specific)/modification methylase